MKDLMMAATLLISMLFSEIALAGSGGPGSISREQARQHRSIHRGIVSGKITHKEAVHLHKQQAQINQYKKLAKCDGKITRRERAFIKAEQAQLSRNIYLQKHDCNKR